MYVHSSTSSITLLNRLTEVKMTKHLFDIICYLLNKVICFFNGILPELKVKSMYKSGKISSIK